MKTKAESMKQRGRAIPKKRMGRKSQCSVECDLCGKKLCNKQSLSWHIRTHTREKRYQCNVCGHRFTLKQSVDSHKRALHR